MTARFAAIALLIASAGHAQSGLQTVQLADNVFAILQPFENRFNDSNAIVIVADAGAMVIDSQVSPESARAVIAQIRKITSKPVQYVVATHWHGDHFQGNQAYRDAYPGVQFVAHETAAEDMRTRATRMRDDDVAALKKELSAADGQLAKGIDRDGKPLTSDGKRLMAERIARNRRYLAALQSITFVFPTMTIGKQMLWHLGNREVRLIHLRGHTRGDLIVHLPADGILVTGDLVDDMPYLGHGYPSDYLKTLDALGALRWNVMVPGHGAVRRDRDHFQRVSAVFKAIHAEVVRAVQDGLTLEQTKNRIDVAPHRTSLTYGDEGAARAFDRFIPAAIDRMYEELKTP